MVDIASRIAALYPEDRALLLGVLEAIEAKELIEKARDVLGVSPTDDMEQMSTGAGMAEMMTDREGLHIEPPPPEPHRKPSECRSMCAAYACTRKAPIGRELCNEHAAIEARGERVRRRHEAR